MGELHLIFGLSSQTLAKYAPSRHRFLVRGCSFMLDALVMLSFNKENVSMLTFNK